MRGCHGKDTSCERWRIKGKVENPRKREGIMMSKLSQVSYSEHNARIWLKAPLGRRWSRDVIPSEPSQPS